MRLAIAIVASIMFSSSAYATDWFAAIQQRGETVGALRAQSQNIVQYVGPFRTEYECERVRYQIPPDYMFLGCTN